MGTKTNFASVGLYGAKPGEARTPGDHTPPETRSVKLTGLGLTSVDSAHLTSFEVCFVNNDDLGSSSRDYWLPARMSSQSFCIKSDSYDLLVNVYPHKQGKIYWVKISKQWLLKKLNGGERL